MIRCVLGLPKHRTPRVEKSNFYKDLEGVLEWEDTVENTVNGKKR